MANLTCDGRDCDSDTFHLDVQDLIPLEVVARCSECGYEQSFEP